MTPHPQGNGKPGDVAESERENHRLRMLLCEVLKALGNGSGASPECSLVFLASIPEEVRLVMADLRAAAPVPEAGQGLSDERIEKLAREHGATLEDDNGMVPAFYSIPMGKLAPFARALLSPAPAQARADAGVTACPMCKQPAVNLFSVALPGDELETVHCGCLYSGSSPAQAQAPVAPPANWRELLGEQPVSTPPQSAQLIEPATISDERILCLWDNHVSYETGASVMQIPLDKKDKIAFARAVLRAAGSGLMEGKDAARDGVGVRASSTSGREPS